MKRSDIEKRLKRDVEAAAPSDFDAVWKRCETAEDECVPVYEEAFEPLAAGTSAGGGSTGRARFGKKFFFRLAAAFLALALAVGGVLAAVLNPKKDGVGGAPALSLSEGYFILDINPSVEIDYGADGKVTEVVGLNADGEVLLCGMETLVGKEYTAAAKVIVERCVTLGYFTAGSADNAVLVSATKATGDKDEEMTGRMKSLLASAFEAQKIRGVVITGVNDPALTEAADSLGIDAQKYALILDCLALGGTKTEAAYAELSVKELYAEIAKLEKEYEQSSITDLESYKAETERQLFDMVSEKIEDILEDLNERIEELRGEESADDGLSGNQPNGGEPIGTPSGEHGDGQGNGGTVHTPSNGDEKLARYERYIEQLEESAQRIEDARNAGECRAFIKEVLEKLDEMRKAETDLALRISLELAHTELEAVFAVFEATLSEMEQLYATVEERSEARKDKFESARGAEEETFDYADWQKEYEDDFVSSWYEKKRQWNKDREKDMD